MRCCAAVASCTVLRGGGFLPCAARRWLLARCCAVVVSCPVQRGGGFLPDVARRWLLAWCGAAMASCASARRWLLASARCSAAKKVISDDRQVVVRVLRTDIPLPPADARANVGQRRRGVLFLLQPRLQQQLHEQDLTRTRRGGGGRNLIVN